MDIKEVIESLYEAEKVIERQVEWPMTDHFDLIDVYPHLSKIQDAISSLLDMAHEKESENNGC